MADQNPDEISGDELDALMSQFGNDAVASPTPAVEPTAASVAPPGIGDLAQLSDEISADELTALGIEVTTSAPPPKAAPVPPPAPPPAAPASANPEAKLPHLTAEDHVTPDAGIGLLMDVPLRVSIELGRISMTLQQVLALGRGSIIELERLAGEPVDILVNDKVIGRGEVVVIDEYFGVKITELIEPKG
ncbi:MAG: flagellar motor switch protein FliN [Ktedonobacterales bacterium]|nr:flagellar motor switch protein FliN [Ktedonobacterales bacterium]